MVIESLFGAPLCWIAEHHVFGADIVTAQDEFSARPHRIKFFGDFFEEENIYDNN